MLVYHNVFGGSGDIRNSQSQGSASGKKASNFDGSKYRGNSVPASNNGLTRKVTFRGSDREDACSSMGLHPIDEDSDPEVKPLSTNPSEKQLVKI